MVEAVARKRHRAAIGLAGLFTGVTATALGGALLALLVQVLSPPSPCGSQAGQIAGPAYPAGSGRLVGASEYGGPGDPSSGTVGASGASLLANPDTYAELGGFSFQTATAMGGLPYMTPIRVSWGGHSGIAYKRDFGLGGGPVDGLPRVIDLWWQFAQQLRIPYSSGLWSGPVRIALPPATGAGNVLGQTAPNGATLVPASTASADAAACAPDALAGVPITAGPRAQLLRSGQAAAPEAAPPAVKAMIAAGNQIVGRPYVYGAAHGVPLSTVAPAYDCSSSVEHLLYGARLLPITGTEPSGGLESFGVPGPGRWVTLYANADHVFMYVAGLRWDTHDAAGAGDGSGGIGWHPLIRTAAGFVARHPEGL
jgi:hypothetical protein